MSEHPSSPYLIRPMERSEIHRINELDVTDAGAVIYKWLKGRVQAVRETWQRPPRPPDEWAQKATAIRSVLDQGGVALGAFAGDGLVGFAAVRFELVRGFAQLYALWVSKAFRRRGIATALVSRALADAERAGACAVYVSASPAEAAQAFYRRQGFRPAAFVHRDLFDREPDDIHMVKALHPMRVPLQDWLCLAADGGDHEQ